MSCLADRVRIVEGLLLFDEQFLLKEILLIVEFFELVDWILVSLG